MSLVVVQASGSVVSYCTTDSLMKLYNAVRNNLIMKSVVIEIEKFFKNSKGYFLENLKI